MNPNYQKQKLDLEIAERVARSYYSTRIIAWASFIIAPNFIVFKVISVAYALIVLDEVFTAFLQLRT
jgi:hypothetical protein